MGGRGPEEVLDDLLRVSAGQPPLPDLLVLPVAGETPQFDEPLDDVRDLHVARELRRSGDIGKIQVLD